MSERSPALVPVIVYMHPEYLEMAETIRQRVNKETGTPVEFSMEEALSSAMATGLATLYKRKRIIGGDE